MACFTQRLMSKKSIFILESNVRLFYLLLVINSFLYLEITQAIILSQTYCFLYLRNLFFGDKTEGFSKVI